MDEYEMLQRVAKARGRELDRAIDQITKLEAERGRLRAVVEAERHVNLASGCPDCGVHHGCGLVVAERDRLRAVVDAARQLGHDQTCQVSNRSAPCWCGYGAVEAALAALNVSPGIGGEE
jgi:hypothetical protein